MEKSKLMIALVGTLLVAGCSGYGHLTPAQKEYIAFRDYCSYHPQAQVCLNAQSPGGGANNTSGSHGGGHGGHGK